MYTMYRIYNKLMFINYINDVMVFINEGRQWYTQKIILMISI